MFLVSLLLISNLASADIPNGTNTVAAANECRGRRVQQDVDVPKATKDAIYQACLKVATSQVELTRVNNLIRTTTEQASINKCIEKERVAGQSTFERIAPTWLGGKPVGEISDSMIDKCRASVRKAQDALLAQKAELERQQLELKKQESDLVASTSSAISDANTARSVAAVVGLEFANMKMSVLELLRQSDQGERQLEKIASAIDNSALGIYMRDRMAGLLNSDVMCKMITDKKCPLPVSGKDLNKVFNSKIQMKAVETKAAPATAAPAGTNR